MHGGHANDAAAPCIRELNAPHLLPFHTFNSIQPSQLLVQKRVISGNQLGQRAVVRENVIKVLGDLREHGFTKGLIKLRVFVAVRFDFGAQLLKVQPL